MLKNTENSYGNVAKIFHWLLFMMLSFSVIAGNILVDMPKGEEKWQAIALHKSFGAVILMLIVMRLIWRTINVTPKPEEHESNNQQFMANIMHRTLYGLMLAQPLAGIIMSQAAGYPVSFFGLFDFPVFLEKSKMLAEVARSAHGIIWIILTIAVFGHVAAAMYHHFITKDNTLRRMTAGA